jgi:hypothetical protein
MNLREEVGVLGEDAVVTHAYIEYVRVGFLLFLLGVPHSRVVKFDVAST